MKIMSVNSGSSSVKMQLFLMPEEKIIAKFGFEKVGFKGTSGKSVIGNNIKEFKLDDNTDHSTCINKAIDLLIEEKIIDNINDIEGVGHRVVMGADKFNKSVIVDSDVKTKIKDLFSMAPLHNPANYDGIEGFYEASKEIVQVASFDTAYHQTIPMENYIFPIPMKYYKNNNVRRYGAHGISVNYIVDEYAKLNNKKNEDVNIIVCHIGSGASITSVINGKSYDTSMGLTPLGGIAMGTRSGDLDPSVVLELMKLNNNDVNKVKDILNKESGLLGMSELSNDMRDIVDNKDNNENASIAYNVFINRILETIGSYAIKHKNLDGIVFCAGILENSTQVQIDLKKQLSNIGVDTIKDNLFESRNGFNYLSTTESKIDLLIINTDEELMIARDTYKLIK